MTDSRRTASVEHGRDGSATPSNISNNSFQANQFNTTLRENEIIGRLSIDSELRAIAARNRERQLQQLQSNLTNITSRVENPNDTRMTIAQQENENH